MRKITALIGLIVCTNVFAIPSQDLLWEDVIEVAQLPSQALQNGKSKAHNRHEEHALLRRSLSLDEASLKQHLFARTKTLKARLSKNNNVVFSQTELDLPLPNGDFVRVRAIDSPILSPELAASYPEIKTWRVVGVDDPAITGRIDFTRKGFHGMLILADGETIFIDPDTNDSNLYHSLSKRDNQAHFNEDFICEVHGKHSLLSDSDVGIKQSSTKTLSGQKLAQIPADNLITYRLALAGTAEYTAAVGGSPASAYASMVTTINRVNQVYQRDIGVKLQLVTGQQYIYTNAATDPYTDYSSTALVNENMASLHDAVGAANYDIGHVFARGSSGGLAYVGVACLNEANILNAAGGSTYTTGLKSGGATGLPNPQGEIFNIQLVAHELGHQLGASHTFNGVLGSCGGGNRMPEGAVEPGGGSTIMSYSGICGADSFQQNADAMFHWKSIDQINEYTRIDNTGSSCGTRTATGNQKPIADAGADQTIPVNTPFLLDGTATGGISYTWDQMDAGTKSNVDDDKGDNAIIRTLLPSSDQDRYIPRLSDLFAGTTTKGEITPQTVRNLNFAFVVRDDNGGIASDAKLISTEDTGAIFSVQSQATAQTYTTGQAINVDWNVASTNNAPISCAKVNIQLLRVDGVRNDLLMDTDNDGGETLVVPGSTPTMTNARVMVACANQPFFQISTGNIAIQQGVDSTPPVITITGSSTIDVVKGLSYSDQGATATDDLDITVSVSSVSTVDTNVLGIYTVTYTATDNAGNTSTKVRTVNVVLDTIAPVITLIGPNTLQLIKESTYTDAGATAIDNVDGSIAVTKTGAVDTSVLGVYTITYSSVDSAGNIATGVTRTVTIIEDTIAPVITLVGSSTVNIVQGQNYIDAGATASDNFDANVSVIVSGSVDANAFGVYTITYSAVDAAGNIANTITRTINVIADTLAPVITLFGTSTMDVNQGDDYSDSGASALDNVDGLVTVDLSGAVDTSTVGTYLITYSATDNAGNTSTRDRTVNVVAQIGGNSLKEVASSGGSMGFLLLPLALFGLRRRISKFRSH